MKSATDPQRRSLITYRHSDGLPPALDRWLQAAAGRQLPGCADLPIIALTANAQGDRNLPGSRNERLPGQATKRTDLQQILQRWVQ